MVEEHFMYMPVLWYPDSLACPTWLAVDKHSVGGLNYEFNYELKPRAIYWITQTFLATSTEHLANCLLENADAASPTKASVYWVAHIANSTYEEVLGTSVTGPWRRLGYRRACLANGNDYIEREPNEVEHRE